MKTILTLYSKPFPPEMLRVSEDFYTYARKKGVIICRGFIADFNPKNKTFKKALFFENHHWTWKKNIRPDAVHDRSLHYQKEPGFFLKKSIEKNFPFFNKIDLSEIMTNKWTTYKTFRKFSPKMVLIKGPSDLKKINSLPTNDIILKPIHSSGGKGIKISTKKTPVEMPFPFLAQELIKTTGYKTWVKGAHDLRIMLINETPFHTYLRIPPKGKLIANTSQGGKIKLLKVPDLPKSLHAILSVISKKFKPFKKKLYAVDFIFDKNERPWIIELNSRPGIALEKEELPVRDTYYDYLINFYLSL
jgi:glutathione synthase/RimK-type ligase-like ATP-grasp enzyme